MTTEKSLLVQQESSLQEWGATVEKKAPTGNYDPEIWYSFDEGENHGRPGHRQNHSEIGQPEGGIMTGAQPRPHGGGPKCQAGAAGQSQGFPGCQRSGQKQGSAAHGTHFKIRRAF